MGQGATWLSWRQPGHVAASPGRSGIAFAAPVAGHGPSARSNWLVALVALLGLLLVTVFGLLAFRLARTFRCQARRSGCRHRTAPRRRDSVGRTPTQVAFTSALPGVVAARCSHPFADAGARRPRDAALPRASASDDIPVFPAGRFVVEESNTPSPARAHRLFVDTQPTARRSGLRAFGKATRRSTAGRRQAPSGWCWRAAGYHMFRTTVDAGEGTLIRLALGTR